MEIRLVEGTGKKILFAISGGSDSALLLYFIAKYNRDQQTNHQIIPFTVPRPDGGANYSPAIVEWISNKLGVDIPAPMIVGDGNLEHNIVVKKAIKDLLESNEYDFLYVAENKIPEEILGGTAPVRSQTQSFKRAELPFWGVTKDYIIDLYYKEGIEELLTLSHSCTDVTIGRCNICFQCRERAWAFDKLGKTDPGTK